MPSEQGQESGVAVPVGQSLVLDAALCESTVGVPAKSTECDSGDEVLCSTIGEKCEDASAEPEELASCIGNCVPSMVSLDPVTDDDVSPDVNVMPSFVVVVLELESSKVVDAEIAEAMFDVVDTTGSGSWDVSKLTDASSVSEGRALTPGSTLSMADVDTVNMLPSPKPELVSTMEVKAVSDVIDNKLASAMVAGVSILLRRRLESICETAGKPKFGELVAGEFTCIDVVRVPNNVVGVGVEIPEIEETRGSVLTSPDRGEDILLRSVGLVAAPLPDDALSNGRLDSTAVALMGATAGRVSASSPVRSVLETDEINRLEIVAVSPASRLCDWSLEDSIKLGKGDTGTKLDGLPEGTDASTGTKVTGNGAVVMLCDGASLTRNWLCCKEPEAKINAVLLNPDDVTRIALRGMPMNTVSTALPSDVDVYGVSLGPRSEVMVEVARALLEVAKRSYGLESVVDSNSERSADGLDGETIEREKLSMLASVARVSGPSSGIVVALTSPTFVVDCVAPATIIVEVAVDCADPRA